MPLVHENLMAASSASGSSPTFEYSMVPSTSAPSTNTNSNSGPLGNTGFRPETFPTPSPSCHAAVTNPASLPSLDRTCSSPTYGGWQRFVLTFAVVGNYSANNWKFQIDNTGTAGWDVWMQLVDGGGHLPNQAPPLPQQTTPIQRTDPNSATLQFLPGSVVTITVIRQVAAQSSGGLRWSFAQDPNPLAPFTPQALGQALKLI